jgi:hypothetical protein
MSPTALGTPYLGLQVGWPILASVLVSTALLVRAALRRGARRSDGLRSPGAGLLVPLLAAWALAFFIVWSPVDFWRYVPSLFYNLQITYRILMFVVLWGSLLAGVSLALAFRGLGRSRGRVPARVAWACVLVVALAAMPYSIWERDRMPPSEVSRLVAHPEFGDGEIVYRPDVGKLERYLIRVPPGVRFVPAAASAPNIRHGRASKYRAVLSERAVVQLPVLFYPGLMEVRDRGEVSAFGQIDGLVALDLQPGGHRVSVQFAGVGWANIVSAVAAVGVAVVAGVALWRRVRGGRVGPRRHANSPRRRGARPEFGVRAAARGFVLLAVPLSLPAAYDPCMQWFRRWLVGTVVASSEAGKELRAWNVIDGDERTAWAAAGSRPASLTILPRRARDVSMIELLPRRTSLLEGWHEVGVTVHLDGREVGRQSFVLRDAARQPVQQLRLDQPAMADRIELHFARPVTLMLDGQRHVNPGAVNPGYSEIRIR